MIELIWDTASMGTATTPVGASITIGEAADFSPEDLVAAAAAGCVMRTFLRLADEARIPILGYTAASRIESAETGAAQVRIRCSVVTCGDVVEADVRRLLGDALNASPVSGMLGARVVCQADVRCLCGAYPG